MTKITTCLTGAAIATATALAFIQPASALVIANGSLTLSPQAGAGLVTVDTTDITLATSAKTEPALEVDTIVGNLKSVITAGDIPTITPMPLPVPAGSVLNGDAVPLTGLDIVLAVDGLEFTFTDAITNSRVALDLATETAGSFALQYTGTLTNGAGTFVTGTSTTLSETCTQSATGGVKGLISCTNSLTVGKGGDVPVPEPASLSILGASLIGFSLLRRRRTQA